MLMRTPERHRPTPIERLSRLFSELFRPRGRPACHGSVDDLSDRLRQDVGAPPRLPGRPPGFPER